MIGHARDNDMIYSFRKVTLQRPFTTSGLKVETIGGTSLSLWTMNLRLSKKCSMLFELNFMVWSLWTMEDVGAS